MNFKSWYKYALYSIFIIFIVSFQVSFLGNINKFLANFNIVLAVLVVLVSLVDYRNVLFFSLVSGFLMDVYSGLPFGIFMGSFFLMSVVLEILFLNFFTNHSYYSLISMGLISIIIYNIIFVAIRWMIYIIGAADFLVGTGFWLDFLYQIISIFLIITFLFWLINTLSKMFKPTFLKS